MRELNKQEIQVIARVVKSRQAWVNKNAAIWEFVHQEFNIGVPEGNKYHLSRDDFEKLRSCVEAISGIDPLKYDEYATSKDRLAGASSLGNEKHAKQSPTYHRIRVTACQGRVMLKTGECKLPPGTTLDVRYDDIPTPDAVIVCENLEVFNQWHLVNLPETLKGTIACYRGHDGQARQLKHWLMDIQGSCNIIMFPDFDPSGIRNALSPRYLTHSLLIPTTSFEHTQYHRNLFIGQAKDMAEISRLERLSPEMKCLIESLNTVKASYTQELMVANQQELRLIAV